MANYRPSYRYSRPQTRHYNQSWYDWYRTKGQYKMGYVGALPGFHAYLQYKDAEKYRNDYVKNTGRNPAYVTFNRGYYNGSSAFGDAVKMIATVRGASKLYRNYESMW